MLFLPFKGDDLEANVTGELAKTVQVLVAAWNDDSPSEVQGTPISSARERTAAPETAGENL